MSFKPVTDTSTEALNGETLAAIKSVKAQLKNVFAHREHAADFHKHMLGVLSVIRESAKADPEFLKSSFLKQLFSYMSTPTNFTGAGLMRASSARFIWSKVDPYCSFGKSLHCEKLAEVTKVMGMLYQERQFSGLFSAGIKALEVCAQTQRDLDVGSQQPLSRL